MFIVVKYWKQSKCPTIWEWEIHRGYINRADLSFVTGSVNLGGRGAGSTLTHQGGFTELSRTKLVYSQSLGKQDTPLWGARGQRMASRHRVSSDTMLRTQHQQGSTYVQTIINTPGERCQSQHPGIRKRSPFLPQGPSSALYRKCLILCWQQRRKMLKAPLSQSR